MMRLTNILLAPARAIGRVVLAVLGLFDAADLQLLAGLGLLFYGIYQIDPPWAFIVIGAILAFGPITNAFQRTRDEKR